MNAAVEYCTHASPIGELLLAGDRQALHAIFFPDERTRRTPDPAWRRGDNVLLRAVCEQLDDYFRGARQAFDLPLMPRGTAFQRLVWRQLQRIPFGRTCSYGELATAIGRPQASRAVGAANGANPIPIVIPCHRVIGADGTLTGFGGGLACKAWLLGHEHALPQAPPRQGSLWS